MDDQTIIHLSTPRLTSAIHVIRLSGEKSLSFLEKHTSLTGVKPRQVYYRDFTGPQGIIDSVICFFFASPNSYTGEDMAEIHTHGSLLIVDDILRLAEAEGCRLARPGEFTYRAFLNGKIGLEQAEAIDGIIQARSDFQRDNALKVLQEKVSFRFTDLKNAIAAMLAELESVIEFPEEDIPEITVDRKTRYGKYRNSIDGIIDYFTEIWKNYQAGKKISEGFRFMIIGSPNSGKSTLFNLLLREGRALVSDQRGTTRDYISERYFLKAEQVGQSNGKDRMTAEVVLYDTAGIHENPESIEAMGIGKLPDLSDQADLLIWLVSGWDCYQNFKASSTGKQILERIRSRGDLLSDHLWIFLNKNDMVSPEETERIQEDIEKEFQDLPITLSGRFSFLSQPQKSREDIEKRFKEWIKKNYPIDYDSPALLNNRQGDLAERILQTLKKIRKKIDCLEGEEIVAEEILILNRDLKKLTLDAGVEEVYDLLFSRFCIGK